MSERERGDGRCRGTSEMVCCWLVDVGVTAKESRWPVDAARGRKWVLPFSLWKEP